MINKENDNNEVTESELEKQPGFTDVAIMDIQCHIMITDVDTKEILVNKRG